LPRRDHRWRELPLGRRYRHDREKGRRIVNSTASLSADVFVNDPPPQDNGLLQNGEPKRFSPQASTLVYGDDERC
jgi:hypothetical protein